MHSGFAELRNALPMDFNARKPLAKIPKGAGNDIRRIVAIWREARKSYGRGGPFLYGGLSVADAMYAPVCSRFTTYAVDLKAHGDDGTAEAYRAVMMALPAMVEWGKGA
jgi:glutathione S-transferase